MARNPLYGEQLRFLEEEGGALAQAFPQVAGSLAEPGEDPDVERLLEGIAFISSKITERQAAGVEEISQLLLDILLPHYLCPVPAATVVQFQRDSRDSLYIPRGTKIVSAPVLGTPCWFRTTMATECTGLRVERAEWQPRGAQTRLTLWLSSPEQIRSDDLRLFLHGEPLLTRSLLEWLLTRVEVIELVDENGLPLQRLPIEPQAAGFSDDEALLSYPTGSFSGFRLLQEYFALPHKFLFLDLPRALACARDQLRGTSSRFGLRFGLRVSGQALMVTEDNFLLDCTPAINLFEHTADPIKRDQARIDYRIRPSGPHLHFDIYRVLGVSGFSREGVREYPLLSEIDLRHSGPTFAQLYRKVFQGTINHYLFVHDERGKLPVDQTLLVDLLASNGTLPSALAVGDIRDVPKYDGVSCTNVIPSTRYWAPQLGEPLRRRLVKHLALTQQELSSVEALQDAIELYHFPAFHDATACRSRDLLLGALNAVETTPLRTPARGGPILGRSTSLTVDEPGFESAAEIYLFGCLLDQYIARSVPINTTSRFSIRGIQSGVSYQWPIHIGPMNLKPR